MSIMVGTGAARERRAVRERGGAREAGKVDHARRGQDGHAHRGQAEAGDRDAARTVRRSVLLRLAASLENASEHPLAAAIVAGAAERGRDACARDGFRVDHRQGRRRRRGRRRVAVGNLTLLRVSCPSMCSAARNAPTTLRRDGQTVVFVAVDGGAAGLLGVADPIKATTPEAIEALQQRRRQGRDADRRQPDDRRGRRAQVGIDEVDAEVLPDQKADVVKRLQARGARRRDGGRRRQRRAGAGARPTWASRWARARTSRWRAPASRS